MKTAVTEKTRIIASDMPNVCHITPFPKICGNKSITAVFTIKLLNGLIAKGNCQANIAIIFFFLK